MPDEEQERRSRDTCAKDPSSAEIEEPTGERRIDDVRDFQGGQRNPERQNDRVRVGGGPSPEHETRARAVVRACWVTGGGDIRGAIQVGAEVAGLVRVERVDPRQPCEHRAQQHQEDDSRDRPVVSLPEDRQQSHHGGPGDGNQPGGGKEQVRPGPVELAKLDDGRIGERRQKHEDAPTGDAAAQPFHFESLVSISSQEGRMRTATGMPHPSSRVARLNT